MNLLQRMVCSTRFKSSCCSDLAACMQRQRLSLDNETRPAVQIVGASSGRYTNLALDDRGRLFSWGYDGCGTGGRLPPRNEMYAVRHVNEGSLLNKRVTAFDSGECGRGIG